MHNGIQNLVIGGGPAGSMLAMRLAAAGREVLLLEREREPHHKVCGEFLSREAVAYLKQAEVDPRASGAQVIRRLRLHVSRTSFETELPFTALSLSRRALDECLLAKAAVAGACVRRGVHVEAVNRTGTRWSVSLRGGQTLESTTVFLATGKHDLRGRERGIGTQNDLVGLKLHLKLSASHTERLRGVMDLFLFDSGYGGLALIEDDVANLCLVIRSSRFRQLQGWHKVLASILNEIPSLNLRLNDGSPAWPKPLAVSPIPYGYLARQAPDDLWRLGDQIAVIPSFTGDGMSIAMHSAALAAEMCIAGKTAQAYARCLTGQLGPAMRLASVLSRAAVTSAGRMIAPVFLRCVPGAMRSIATATRIPERALLADALTTDSAESA